MTSRERVFRCLEFRTPDRAPRDLWMVPYIGLHRRDELEAVERDYPGDFTYTSDIIPPGDRRRGTGGVRGSYTDDWGCVWESAEDGVTGEVKHPLLADWAALDAYRPPWERVTRGAWGDVARDAGRNLAGANPRFLMAWSSVNPFERLQFLRGTEALLMDMAYDTAEWRRLFTLVHEWNLATIEHWAQTPVDGIFFMDDWGSQTSLLISPEMWRATFKPAYAAYCDIIRRAGKKVMFHSDGMIAPIFGDLVEIGVDVLNSQLFTMDIEALASRYKGRVTFWGELDRQHTLPFGGTEDVRRAVARVRRALDDGRGGVIAQVEWGAVVPAANIRAAYDAWLAPLDTLAP